MIKLFFSYSHRDEAMRDELEKHLAVLKRKNIIDTWHDRRIGAGSNFSSAISNNLKQADIILLLVSPDFLDSDYCYDKEMKEAIHMHERQDAVVIPVILRHCDWHDTLFGELLALPKDGQPITTFSNTDEAFLDITKGIKSVIANVSRKSENIPSNKSTPNAPILSHRSSNLAVTKKFTDHEKDQFLRDTFSYIENFFEASLAELKKINPHINYLTDKVDSKTFTASVYKEGNLTSECMLFTGSRIFSKSINYSYQISSSKDSLNETMQVVDDGYNLLLKPMGMSSYGLNDQTPLTNKGAAEYYWQMFIKRLQGR